MKFLYRKFQRHWVVDQVTNIHLFRSSLPFLVDHFFGGKTSQLPKLVKIGSCELKASPELPNSVLVLLVSTNPATVFEPEDFEKKNDPTKSSLFSRWRTKKCGFGQPPYPKLSPNNCNLSESVQALLGAFSSFMISNNWASNFIIVRWRVRDSTTEPLNSCCWIAPLNQHVSQLLLPLNIMIQFCTSMTSLHLSSLLDTHVCMFFVASLTRCWVH